MFTKVCNTYNNIKTQQQVMNFIAKPKALLAKELAEKQPASVLAYAIST